MLKNLSNFTIMSSQITYKSNNLNLERYPKTNNKSLIAVNAVDEFLLKYCEENTFVNCLIYNDRFGALVCPLFNEKPRVVWTYASQMKAIQFNCKLNGLNESELEFVSPLDSLNKIEAALIKVPKSLELFQFFLQQIHKSSNEDTEVVCGFMTKYFTPKMLEIASQYFDSLKQSKAHKKARLLFLKKPKKEVKYISELNSIAYSAGELHQYLGVFSADKVDVGTQFLLEDLELNSNELTILDVASGNGVIAKKVQVLNPESKVTLVDDFWLAVESSKLNLEKSKSNFICDDNLNQIEDESFDLVLSNPPFHFEFEVNIEVSLSLFKDIHRCLKPEGRFVLVANNHLNYTTHLLKIFKKVIRLKQNRKFEVLECIK